MKKKRKGKRHFRMRITNEHAHLSQEPLGVQTFPLESILDAAGEVEARVIEGIRGRLHPLEQMSELAPFMSLLYFSTYVIIALQGTLDRERDMFQFEQTDVSLGSKEEVVDIAFMLLQHYPFSSEWPFSKQKMLDSVDAYLKRNTL